MAGDEVKQEIKVRVLDGNSTSKMKEVSGIPVIDLDGSDDDSGNGGKRSRVSKEVDSNRRKKKPQFWQADDFEGHSAAVWDAFSVKQGSASVLNMAGSSSSPHLYQLVDDFYFSVLHDEDEIFPISDEKYAEALQLQEALIISSSSSPNANAAPDSHASSSKIGNSKQPLEAADQLPESTSFCDICMDTKMSSEMFRNINVCGHLYCIDCIRSHVAAKIKENITRVKCPDPKCQGEIGPELCRNIVPKQVLERWEDSLCESLILASEKLYCPFKDCSAMLVDDGGQTVTSSECPNCNRLFCAQCKVAWHSGMNCREFQGLNKGERDPEDIMLMELAKNKKWRRCPKCRFFVEKTQGCLHISCRCGFHFCYGCGKEHDGTHACPPA